MISRGQNKGVELDLLEDIFRQKERDLEKGILNFTLRDKDCDPVLRTKAEEDRMLTEMHLTSNIIHVKISRCNSFDEDADVCDVTLAPKSPTLLSAPLPSLTYIRSKYHPPMQDEMFVSGIEAERQQIETKTLGNDTAHALADRRASYTRKLRAHAEDETNFVERYVEIAKEEKRSQLQLSENIESSGTEASVRRATLWRRCAAMADVLAKEEAERLLWKKMFCVAAHHVYGNKGFY
ncbi:uncharacterized protein LOC114518320 isoform X2 [Dendronephthya gigantea]|nr:uncharacterized protein LOC114518320 isoform X2 [Dendronephthya gigantea]